MDEEAACARESCTHPDKWAWDTLVDVHLSRDPLLPLRRDPHTVGGPSAPRAGRPGDRVRGDPRGGRQPGRHLGRSRPRWPRHTPVGRCACPATTASTTRCSRASARALRRHRHDGRRPPARPEEIPACSRRWPRTSTSSTGCRRSRSTAACAAWPRATSRRLMTWVWASTNARDISAFRDLPHLPPGRLRRPRRSARLDRRGVVVGDDAGRQQRWCGWTSGPRGRRTTPCGC